jgi:hypothetical protein
MKRPRLNKLSLAERVELNRNFKDAMETGLIRPIHNELGSLILFARKGDGSLRLCIDYRGLNELTRKDAYLLPRVDGTLDEPQDAKFTLISTSRLASDKFECMIKTSTRLRLRYMVAY